ncbi:hypothetical protein VNO77_23159 [Canavalia gladiata]|uniref:Uncharacterized protein n=1 Tax=Canavalia gladiata TaxID=3824 RepID=A0AAN9QBM8_CANGL
MFNEGDRTQYLQGLRDPSHLLSHSLSRFVPCKSGAKDVCHKTSDSFSSCDNDLDAGASDYGELQCCKGGGQRSRLALVHAAGFLSHGSEQHRRSMLGQFIVISICPKGRVVAHNTVLLIESAINPATQLNRDVQYAMMIISPPPNVCLEIGALELSRCN